MKFLIRTFVYFIVILVIDVSATVLARNNIDEKETAFPINVIYNDGEYLNMAIALKNLPPGGVGISYVAYYYDNNRTIKALQLTFEKYENTFVEIRQKSLSPFKEIVVKVGLKTNAVLCANVTIVKARKLTASNITTNANTETCLKQLCVIEVDFKNECKNNASVTMRGSVCDHDNCTALNAFTTGNITDLSNVTENYSVKLNSTENIYDNLDQSYPYHLTYKLGDSLDMSFTLSFPRNSTTIYVTYQADNHEKKTTTDVYRKIRLINIQKLLKDITRVWVKVELKTEVGFCRQNVLEGALENMINTTGFPLLDTCVGERCTVKANLPEGSCKDNEIPFVIWSATRCYGSTCNMKNGTRNITAIFVQKRQKILDIINASEMRIEEIKKQNSWYTKRFNVSDFIDTHFTIPQIPFHDDITYEKDMEDLRKKIRDISGHNVGSTYNPAKAFVLLVIMGMSI